MDSSKRDQAERTFRELNKMFAEIFGEPADSSQLEAAGVEAKAGDDDHNR